jgi:hypothetical protein
MRHWLTLAIAGLSVAATAHAQPDAGHAAAGDSVRSTAAAQNSIFAVPESPAFTYLGMSPTRIARPTTARDLGVQLLDGVDSLGRSVQGFAIEVTPWLLRPAWQITLDDYRKSRLKYMFANLQMSLGTVKTSGDSASTDMAFGLRVTLIDHGDPMLSKEYEDGLVKILKNGPSPDVVLDDHRMAEFNAAKSAKIGALRQQWLRERWNAARLVLAGATGLRLLESQLDRSYGLGGGVWMSGAAPVSGWGQLLGMVQWNYRRALGASPKQSLLSYGARINAGSERANAYAEVVSMNELNARSGADASSGQWSGGVEFRLAAGLWAATGLGSNFGLEAGADRVVVVANLRWAVSGKSRIDPRGK